LERGVYGVEWGNGEFSLRATSERGGQDPITARRVPSKKMEMKREQKGMGKEKQKAGDCSMNAL
jgi:hypothetical protein